MDLPLIAITLGDPTGIGAEIIAKALAHGDVHRLCRPVVLGDKRVLERALLVAKSKKDLQEVKEVTGPEVGANEGIIHFVALTELADSDIIYGKPTTAAGDAAYQYITAAAKLCVEGKVAAMATAPINKDAMNRAGHKYHGHTELLAEVTGTTDYVMMLAGSQLKVTLVTIHEALRDIPSLLTKEKILSTIRTTHQDLQRYFTPSPRLAVLALNPHCGEGGMFGDEEERLIVPAIQAAQAEGIDAVGPLSADTLFHFAVQGRYHAVVCMYHDQGLIPLKLVHFDDGVNVTLGLPIIRTSVDHGTAYDLAGTGRASETSMVAAITMAAEMAAVRQRNQGC